MHQLSPDDSSSKPSGSTMPYAEMVLRACGKDRQAFGMLYEHYKVPILRRLRGLINDKEEAYDLYQEMFLRIWKHFLQLESVPQETIENFEPWLYKTTRNIALDYLRRHKKYEFFSIPQGEPDEPDEYALYAHPKLREAGGEEQVCNRLYLDEVLAQMSPRYRICYVLRKMWGCKNREIAELLDISEKTVSTNIIGAYKQLRTILLNDTNAAMKGGSRSYGKADLRTL